MHPVSLQKAHLQLGPIEHIQNLAVHLHGGQQLHEQFWEIRRIFSFVQLADECGEGAGGCVMINIKRASAARVSVQVSYRMPLSFPLDWILNRDSILLSYTKQEAQELAVCPLQQQQIAGLDDVLRRRTPMDVIAGVAVADSRQFPNQRHQLMCCPF